MDNRPHIPRDLPTVKAEDLTGRVRRAYEGMHPNHTGGFSDVYIGDFQQDISSTRTIRVAIKVLRLLEDEVEVNKVKTKLIRETVVWIGLRHRNILKFYGTDGEHARHGCPALISRYCNKGTVMPYLKSHPRADNVLRHKMITGVVDGLQYLHEKNVVHGDLKPSNILMDDQEHPLLCDFGHAKIITHKGFTTKSRGTVRYRAPEHLEDETEELQITRESDIYSLAMTCTEIWTGLMPYSRTTNDQAVVLAVVSRGCRPPCPDNAPVETKSLWDLLEKCWKSDPPARLKIDDVARNLHTLQIQ